MIVEGLERAAAGGAFAIAVATDHDSHAALGATRRELARRRLTPDAILEFEAGEPDPSVLAGRLIERRPVALLVLAPPRAAGRLVAAVRAAGFRGPILGGATAARAAFLRAAGPAAEGVLSPVPVAKGPAWEAFERAYEKRWKEPPDLGAARAYDAVRLAGQAVRRAGLNRALVRDTIRDLAPWPGASATVSWNALGRCDTEVTLGSWVGGRLEVARLP